MKKTYSVFETELRVRPDDIDMNQHVHNSRYFDYVLAARFDQMERFYKTSIEDFSRHGYSWVIDTAHIEFKRPLQLGEYFLVRTWMEEIEMRGVRVGFEIVKRENGKQSCAGTFHYTMIDLKTGRAAVIPKWMIERYSI